MLLLDAGVVTRLVQWGFWEKVIERYDVHLAGTVAEEVEQEYEDDFSQWCPCSIKQYIDKGKVYHVSQVMHLYMEFLV
ncbi:MAG: hypothetical protein ACYC27_11420 [Armatimonadota bacterium]